MSIAISLRQLRQFMCSHKLSRHPILYFISSTPLWAILRHFPIKALSLLIFPLTQFFPYPKGKKIEKKETMKKYIVSIAISLRQFMCSHKLSCRLVLYFISSTHLWAILMHFSLKALSLLILSLTQFKICRFYITSHLLVYEIWLKCRY